MRSGHLAAPGPHPAHGGLDDAPGAAPAEDEEAGAFLVVELGAGDVVGDAGHLGRPQEAHALVVLGVVRDVAGPVLLLQTTDAVHEAGGAGDGPRTGQGLGVTQEGPEPVAVVLLGGEGHRDVGQRRRPSGSATARCRWPGSRRRGGRPASGTSGRCGTPRWRRRSSGPASGAATMGTGASPCRPYMACSRSACSVLVGMPVDGPPRWMLTMTSGSSMAEARPIVSRLQVDAGAARGGDGQAAAEGGADGGADAGDLVLGLHGPHAEVLCLDSSWRMSDAGVIGYEPRNSSRLGLLGGGDHAVGDGRCCR